MKRFGFLLVGMILWIGASAQVQADTTQVTIPDSVIEKYAATSQNTREAILLQKLNPDQLLEIEKQRLDNERRRESNEIPMPMWALVLISTAPFVMVVFIVFFTSRAKKEREKARYDLYLKSIEMGQPLPEKIFEEPEKKTKQHELFDLSYKNYKDTFEFITPDVLEKETEKIANSNNIKFSDYLQTLEI